MLGEGEGPGPHDVALGELRILLQLRRAVDAVPRAREVGQHRGIGLLQLEDDRQGIGRLDRCDVGIARLPDREHALRRIAQALVGRLDVLGGEGRAVMELDPLPQLEGVAQAVLGDRPRLGKVALERRVFRGVELEQRVVVRPHRMDERERGLRVAVVVGRLGAHRELEEPAGPRRLRAVAAAATASAAAPSSNARCRFILLLVLFIVRDS